MPFGIFSLPDQYSITIASTSFSDVGIYTINLKVNDAEPKMISTSFSI